MMSEISHYWRLWDKNLKFQKKFRAPWQIVDMSTTPLSYTDLHGICMLHIRRMKTVNRNRWFCSYTGDGMYKSEQSEQPFRRLRPSLRKIMAKCVSLLCALLMLQVSRAYDGDAEEDLAPAIKQYSGDFLLQFQPVKRPMTTRLPGDFKMI
jgi:hypothetical protein